MELGKWKETESQYLPLYHTQQHILLAVYRPVEKKSITKRYLRVEILKRIYPYAWKQNQQMNHTRRLMKSMVKPVSNSCLTPTFLDSILHIPDRYKGFDKWREKNGNCSQAHN
jgi:hypothetical protein